jgi:serine protease Do
MRRVITLLSALILLSSQALAQEDFSPDFRAATKRIKPFIVSLGPFSEPMTNPLLKKKLPMFLQPGKNKKKAIKDRETWTAAGLIVEDGYILTSLHALAKKSTNIPLEASTGVISSAQLVASDGWRDLALLKCPGLKSPGKLPWGESKSLNAGIFTIAVGVAPRGPSLSVHVGILSATDRFRQRLLQSDARTHKGVWGGALVNLNGELLGLVTVASNRPKELAGVTFAVPAHQLPALIKTLKKGLSPKKTAPPFLGVYVDTKKFPLTLTRTVPGSPAASAGLKKGDQLIEIGGLEVRDVKSLKAVLARTPASVKLSLLIVRNKKRMRIENIVLKAKPAKTPGKK